MRSMTGYGRFEAQNEQYLVSVELRSVNSRYFESFIKASPKSIGKLEFNLTNLLKSRLIRGKVNATISLEVLKKEDEERIDFAEILSYHHALEKFSKKTMAFLIMAT